MHMDPVVHFEMPAENGKRMSEFYSKSFGWKTTQLGSENAGYILTATSECDEKGYPIKPGRINGGFYQKKNDMPMQYPSVVIAVQNVQDSMKKVKDSGGKVLGEPMDIPGYGTYVSFLDTEGNRVSMMQPLPGM